MPRGAIKCHALPRLDAVAAGAVPGGGRGWVQQARPPILHSHDHERRRILGGPGSCAEEEDERGAGQAGRGARHTPHGAQVEL